MCGAATACSRVVIGPESTAVGAGALTVAARKLADVSIGAVARGSAWRRRRGRLDRVMRHRLVLDIGQPRVGRLVASDGAARKHNTTREPAIRMGSIVA